MLAHQTLEQRRQHHHIDVPVRYHLSSTTPPSSHPFRLHSQNLLPSSFVGGTSSYTSKHPPGTNSTPIRTAQGRRYMNVHTDSTSTFGSKESDPVLAYSSPQFFPQTPLDHWIGSYNSPQSMAAARSLQTALHRNRSHQRAQSSSSFSSAGSGSPYSQSQALYALGMNESTPTKYAPAFHNADTSSNVFSNSLPTPTQTPTQDSFLTTSNSYPQSGNMNGVMEASNTLHTSLDTGDEDLPGMSHSARQSVSSVQDPSTPRTIPESYDDGFKVPTAGELPLFTSQDDASLMSDCLLFGEDTAQQLQQMRFPKLDRTVSDACNDSGFSQASLNAILHTTQPKLTIPHITPQRNMINDFLQAAQAARSSSPSNGMSRGVSPFRPTSPYVSNFPAQIQRPLTAAAMRQAQQANASRLELAQHIPLRQEECSTISPKDAVLEYNESEEDSKMPLFPETDASGFGVHQQQSYLSPEQNLSTQIQHFGNNNWSTRRRSPGSINTNASAHLDHFSTTTPATFQQSLPFSGARYPPPTVAKQDSTPEFPAHLTSMESSASEAPQSSQNSSYADLTTKPVSSTSDSGTYTCTFSNCALRFATPQKLQKHKRDAHRNPSISSASTSSTTVITGSFSPTPGVGSGMTSAQIAARNSQTGPHKCERVNPTTGKPCNTIFSRPYDLTRHEDTIHNMRKHKVRCALCTEEKSFSRNDALTRHMRVVHPEVDFPGKHRRRGALD